METTYRCMNCMEPMDNNKKCSICGYVPKSQIDSNYCLHEGYQINDQYIIGVILISGGFTNTYIGYDRFFQKKVVIKEFLPSEFVSRADSNLNITIKSKKYVNSFNSGKERFLREARILQALSKIDRAVHVEGFFKAHNTAYLVMDYIEGENLYEYLERQPHGKLTPVEGFKLLRPIFDIMKQIHNAGIIHRDINPGNIMITKDGIAKLIEFGASPEMITGSKVKTVMVRQGYSPPEQYTSSGKQGPWTDIYSFAATIYKTVSGITPPSPFERM